MGKLIHTDYPLILDPGHKAYQDRFDETFENAMPVYPQLFQVVTSDKPDETVVAMSDVGEPELRAAGMPIDTERVIAEQWKKTYTHSEYGMKSQIDQALWEDMPQDMRNAYPVHYGRAMNSKAEALAASVVSGGFATTGGDGEFIFDTDHPLGNAVGTWSNLATAALSAASLATVRAAMRSQLSPSGRVMATPFGRLLAVPPALEGTASEITSATMMGVAGGVFNNANFVSTLGVTPVVWEYLTSSSTDWFLFIPPSEVMEGFKFWWRVVPEFNGEFKKEDSYYWMNSRMRISTAAVNPRQAFGNDV
jgi:hypothetical protein